MAATMMPDNIKGRPDKGKQRHGISSYKMNIQQNGQGSAKGRTGGDAQGIWVRQRVEQNPLKNDPRHGQPGSYQSGRQNPRQAYIEYHNRKNFIKTLYPALISG
jgi:hypothetical protein